MTGPMPGTLAELQDAADEARWQRELSEWARAEKRQQASKQTAVIAVDPSELDTPVR